jgi:SulP family sulfate permease
LILESKISDMSAIDAVHKLTERYAKAGKTPSEI